MAIWHGFGAWCWLLHFMSDGEPTHWRNIAERG